MNAKPLIFISAVSSELKSARQLVANTLQFLGYEPVWQDIFGTEQGDLRGMLRQKIDESQGVIQILGKQYGAEPPTPDPVFGRVSYTQYEARYAQKQNKKVWYLVLTPGFPTDAAPPEPEELGALQKKYCDALAGKVLYHLVENPSAMEASVLKLRNDLSTLRRGVRRWAIAVSIVLALLLAQGTWLFIRQFRLSHSIEHIETLLAQDRPVVQAVLQQTVEQPKSGEPLSPEKALDQKIETVARDQHLPPDEVRAKVKSFVDIVQNDPHADPMDKLRAAVVGHCDEDAIALGNEIGTKAEKTFEESAEGGQREAARKQALEAFLMVGQACFDLKQNAQATDAFGRAAAMTDPEKNQLDWCNVQQWLAAVAAREKDYAKAETIIRPVLDIRINLLGPANPTTLATLALLVACLERQHKLTEAEASARSLLDSQEQILGAENDDTLDTRGILAVILADQKKDAEAETEIRKLLAVRERKLAPDDKDILTMKNLLMIVLQRQRKLDEAETVARDLLAVETKSLGPENPDTIGTQTLYGTILALEKKDEEAEKQMRAVIAVRQRVLGPTHSDTMDARFFLFSVLSRNKQYEEAAKEGRTLLADQLRVLGPDHADTRQMLRMMPLILMRVEEYAEAASIEQKMLESDLRVTGAASDEAREAYVSLSWFQLMNRDYAGALRTAEAGRKDRESYLPLAANYAHALLLTGDFDAAQKIYLAHIGEKMPDSGTPWEQSVQTDFDSIEKRGITSADITRMRALLK